MILRKLFFGTLLLTLAASTASAYTLIMRDGRRVQIPDEFIVSGSTLTYEVGTGIQMTIQLSGINIAETEDANGQPRGSFLQRRPAAQPAAKPEERRRTAVRSITNRDLEGYRQARLKSEVAYEKRRKELGLPSREDQRFEAALAEERSRQEIRSRRLDEQNSEQYWRERATTLRTDIASNQAQIDFVRGRLDEIRPTDSFGPFSNLSYGGFGGIYQQPYLDPMMSGTYTSTVIGNGQIRSSVGFPVARPVFGQQGRYNRGRYYDPYGGYGGYGGYGRRRSVLALPFQYYDDRSQERAELTNELNTLERDRAGLFARWREMEEQARRAGAYPGWLRP